MLPSMSAGQWVALAAAAVLVFWMVGAYNRLVAMRTAIGDAFRLVDELVQRRAAAAITLAARAQDAMASEQGALDAWLAAQTASRQAADALRVRPVVATLAARLAASGARVMALLEQHPAILAEPTAAAHLATLRETEARLIFARQLFNEAVQTYNEAVRLFPTRLLARLYGFGTAGRLS